MSEFSQGKGWWQASDGKWYPPEAAPPGFAAPTSGAPTAPVPPVAPTQPFGQPVGQPVGQPMGPPPGVPSTAAPVPDAAKSGLSTGPIIAIVVAAVLVIGAIVFFATSGDGDKQNATATNSSASSASSSSSSRSSSSTRSSSSSSSGAPDVVAPSGFTVFSNDEDAFALAVPDDLEIADLSSGDVDSIINEITARRPEFASFEEQLRTVISGGGKLFAVDLTAPGLGDNLSVVKTPGALDVQSATAKAQLKQQIESFGGANVTFATPTVHGRKILTAFYDASTSASDGSPQSFFGGQAYVPDQGSVWILTLTRSSSLDADFDTIVQTFDVNA